MSTSRFSGEECGLSLEQAEAIVRIHTDMIDKSNHGQHLRAFVDVMSNPTWAEENGQPTEPNRRARP